MKKFLITFLVMTTITVAPFGGFYIYSSTLKNAYSDTFLGELNDKFNRLKNEKEKKIIFVGGSSLPFGLRSDLIEEATSYKVINFGLYATLGTTLMMELSKVNISEGDIVILAPEISQQTYSYYFNPKATLQAFESNQSMKKYLSNDERMSLFYNSYSFTFEKVKALKSNTDYSLLAPYNHDSFNEFGDIEFLRPSNIMSGGYDTSLSIDLSTNLINEEFTSIVNKYYSYCKKKKADMYFSFSPTNERALKDKNQEEVFLNELEDKLKCPILGDVSALTYEANYFYDTNFHLNDAGAILHSKNLSQLICDEKGITNKWSKEDPIKPSIEGENTKIDELDYFIVSKDESQKTISINGIKEEYKATCEEIEINEEYDGYQVIGIGDKAFENCVKLKKLILPSTIKMIVGTPFINCPLLEEIILNSKKPPVIPSQDMFEGTNSNCKCYIPSSSYLLYKNDYTWMNYLSYIAKQGD